MKNTKEAFRDNPVKIAEEDMSSAKATAPKQPSADPKILEENLNLSLASKDYYIAQGLDARPCAVYYTNEVDLCNHPEGLYKMRMQTLKAEQQSARQRGDVGRANALARVIADRESGKLPNGACKVEFPGWVEPTKSDSGEVYPYKNQREFNNLNRGKPEHWAFCFGAGDGSADAVARARAFADEKAVLSTNFAGAPFKDGKTYGKVAFTTLKLDDTTSRLRGKNAFESFANPDTLNDFICTKPPTPITGVPSSWMVIKIAANGTLANPLAFGVFNPGTNRFDPFPNPSDIVSKMFDIQQDGTALYLSPKKIRGAIHQFGFDVCGRVDYHANETTPIQISLANNLGIGRFLLYDAGDADDDTYGTLAVLRQRLTDKSAKLTRIDTPSQNEPTNLKQGYVRHRYEFLTSVSIAPPMDSADQLDLLFYGNPAINKPALMTRTRTDVLQGNPTQSKDMWDGSRGDLVRYGYVVEGYLRLPAGYSPGNYNFRINSDDGGDVFVDNKLVASHFGYHGPDDRGVEIQGVFMEPGKSYKYRARFAQWYGAHGMILSWTTPTRQREEIPGTAIFYDEAETDGADRGIMEQRRTDLMRSKAAITETITMIENKMKQIINVEVQKMSGRPVKGIDTGLASNDGNIYINISPFDGAFADVEFADAAATADIGKILLAEKRDICQGGGIVNVPTPVRNFQKLAYTVCFWIRQDKVMSEWTNILFHGEDDNWGGGQLVDRTPGIWLWPGQTRIHVRHGSSIDQNDGVDSVSWLPLRTWVPVVIRMNGTSNVVNGVGAQTIEIWINGKKDNARALGSDGVFKWMRIANKTFQVSRFGGYCHLGHVMLQHVTWFNRVIDSNAIAAFGSPQKDPTPLNLQQLLSEASDDGEYEMMNAGEKIKVWVGNYDGSKWALALSYIHRAGTNPSRSVIKPGENWPIWLWTYGLSGIDGSTFAPKNEIGAQYAAGATWGHLGNAVMSKLDIKEMLWYGIGGNGKCITFRTSDPNMINYCKTGRGNSGNFSYVTRDGHNSSVPGNAPHHRGDAGDYAMCDEPFFRGGAAHWNVGFWNSRWEVDDYNGGSGMETFHHIWIR